MAMVVNTVIIEPRIDGIMTRKKVCSSEAPSIRAASVSSRGHALDGGGEDHHGKAHLEPDHDRRSWRRC